MLDVSRAVLVGSLRSAKFNHVTRQHGRYRAKLRVPFPLPTFTDQLHREADVSMQHEKVDAKLDDASSRTMDVATSQTRYRWALRLWFVAAFTMFVSLKCIPDGGVKVAISAISLFGSFACTVAIFRLYFLLDGANCNACGEKRFRRGTMLAVLSATCRSCGDALPK